MGTGWVLWKKENNTSGQNVDEMMPGPYSRKQVQQTPSQTINPELMSEFLIQERLTRAGVLHLTL